MRSSSKSSKSQMVDPLDDVHNQALARQASRESLIRPPNFGLGHVAEKLHLPSFLSSSSSSHHHQHQKSPINVDLTSDSMDVIISVCPSCRLPVKSGQSYVESFGHVWHREHFRCEDCAVDLTDGNLFHNHGQLFCPKHCLRAFINHCHRCQEEITGKFIEIAGARYHVECVKCDLCCRPVADGKLHTRGSKLLCNRCYYSLSQGKWLICFNCNQTLRGKYKELHDGRTFHRECLRCNICSRLIDKDYELDSNDTPICLQDIYSGRCVESYDGIVPNLTATTPPPRHSSRTASPVPRKWSPLSAVWPFKRQSPNFFNKAMSPSPPPTPPPSTTTRSFKNHSFRHHNHDSYGQNSNYLFDGRPGSKLSDISISHPSYDLSMLSVPVVANKERNNVGGLKVTRSLDSCAQHGTIASYGRLK